MKIFLVILTAFILLFACNGDKPNKPENLISEQNMEAILYDLYIVTAAKGVNKMILNSKGIHPKDYILNKHKIDSTQFANSNTYYAFYPDKYAEIVDRVKARLETEKTKFEILKKIEDSLKKKEKDSLREINIKTLKKDSLRGIKKRDFPELKN